MSELVKSDLRRALTVWDLVFYGIIVIQPTAPMPVFGVVSQVARGHVVTTIMLAMIAMLLTAVSYGRMARVYPSAGSAYAYVRGEFGNFAGFLAGWGIVLDYLLNPLICTIWCSKAAQNLLPIPFPVWATFFALLFTLLNLRGIESSAATNKWLTIFMSVVVIYMLIAMFRYLAVQTLGPEFLTKPFYDPANFSIAAVSTGTSIAALTYIGFDSISTLSEEVVDPKRNILRATVLTCLVTGLLASIEVYVAQLVWPDFHKYPDVDTAYSFVAGRAGGAVLFHVVNGTLLLATIGSGMGSQLGVARLLYGMGRDNALPSRFFAHVSKTTRIPNYNVLLSGLIALVGAFSITYELGAELLNFGAFLAFTGVNAAAFMHYFVRGQNRHWSFSVLPLAGCVVCLYIWLSLHWQARLLGFSWLLAGAAYALIRRRRIAAL
ncbi:MAG: APC family permease [Acidobacteriaceae bacterium]|nr:APC family permease [Acidobacteriaceae bacterium]MBV9779387.1 APC family permease [Acidobacteriaceae bacterium]